MYTMDGRIRYSECDENGTLSLLAMLNSCAEGVSVVNIDNGFGAAVVACRMLRRLKA